MAKANNETRTTALLFSFSAVVLALLALQPPDRRPGGAAALLVAALDRFLPDGRGLLDLATRRNMVLLCHAILLLILMDAGVLGSPARRRAASTSADGDAVAVAAAPVLTDAAEPERSIVVWRTDGSGRRAVRRRQPRRSAQQHPAAAAAPALAQLLEQQPPLLSKEVVLVEKSPRNGRRLEFHDDHARAGTAVVELELPSATATDGEIKSCFDRRIMVVAGDERNASTEQTEELADDRRIEEFIAKQWSAIRHESLQVERSSSWSQSQAIAIY